MANLEVYLASTSEMKNKLKAPHDFEVHHRDGDTEEHPYLRGFFPPCTCPECDQQFKATADQRHNSYSYSGNLSRYEATVVAAKHMFNINRDFEHLKKQCSLYGDSIISRWRNKTRDKREKVILSADPNIYRQQWLVSHYVEFGDKNSSEWRKMRELHNSYLLPYITLPGLRDDPSKFLSLLLNRTQSAPEQWASYDNSQIRNGWYSAAFNVDHCRCSIIMYGPRYGEVTEWNKSSAERWEGVGFPRAKLVLEAQEQMMGLLRKIVDQLLEGVGEIKAKQSNSSKWHELSTTGFKSTSSAVCWSKYLNQAFSPPPTFNINELLSSVQAHLDEAEDHLWLLQTDPAYMRREMGVAGQAYRKELSAAWEKYGGNCYSFIAKSLMEDFGEYIQWTWIRNECQNVKDTMVITSANHTSGSRISSAITRALGALELLAANLLHDRRGILRDRYMDDPVFSSHWSGKVKNVMNAGQQSAIIVWDLLAEDSKVPAFKQLAKKDLFHWALTQLIAENSEQPDCLDPAILYSIIDDHLSKGSSAEKRRLNTRIYKSIADTAVLQDILKAIRLNRPLSAARTLDDCCAMEDRESWRYFRGKQEPCGIFFSNINHSFTSELKQLSTTLKAFEAVPLPTSGRPDQSWVDSFESRHRLLGQVWIDAQPYWETKYTKAKIPKDVKAYLEVLQAASKPEHVEAMRLEKARILARIAGKSTAPQSANTVQTQWDHQESGTVRASVRTKEKTRQEATQEPQTELLLPIENLQVADEPIAPKVEVKQQAFNLLTAMFNTETRKEYDWVTFVTAMNEVGFPATHTGGGSAVSFDATQSCPWKGRINFHKPHPDSKIDPIILRAMGKRMSRRFGWSEESFEVVEKKV